MEASFRPRAQNKNYFVVELLQRGIARKFRVRQTRIAKMELVSANLFRRKEIHGTRRSDDVVLIDAVAAYTDGADQNAVAIKWKAAGKNRDPVWKVWIKRRCVRQNYAIQNVRQRHRRKCAGRKFGKYFLQSEKWSGLRVFNSGRIM